MKALFRWLQKNSRFAVLAAISVLAGFLLSSGWGGLGNPLSDSPLSSTLDGRERLVSFDPLPAMGMDNQMCEWVPASTSRTLVAALWQQQAAAARAESSADAARREEVAGRKPLRMIRDPYALFSAVAVDPVRNEVVLQDENLFRTLVYDRLANTPPNATMSEPKRIIAGPDTGLGFNCGLYIDPESGDIYSVNNDTQDHMVIHSREAKGNSPPSRKLHTPHGAFGIAVDEEEQEIILTIQHSNAVVTFPKMAKDEEPPVRVLQGDKTLLADPHGIALDTKNDLIFVGNFGSTSSMRPGAGAGTNYFGVWVRGSGLSGEKPNWPLDGGQSIPGSGRNLPPAITVYSKNASGDTAPLRVISGPKTQLNWPAGMTVHSERGELYVANDMGDSILVFSTSANGDVAPIRVLKGPNTLLKYPNGITLDLVNDELWVANFGNHTATVYNLTASGDTKPLRVIRSGPLGVPTPTLANPHPIAYDTKREEILVPN
ncbi:MAG: hypothetical protein O7E51_03305 [Acidobacteria bacterium]|nr:hypothetical protein [Acidobacteriota bacterium]